MKQASVLIRDDLLPQLFKNCRIGLVASLLAGTLYVIAMRTDVPIERLLVWYGVLVLVSIARMMLTQRFFRRDPRTDERTPWDRYYLRCLGATGAVWGLSSLFLYPSGDLTLQLFHIFILIGLTATAPVVYAPSTRSLLWFNQPILIPLTIRLLMEGGIVFTAMAALSVIYNISMVLTARNFSNLELQLRRAKIQAEAASEAKSRFLAKVNHELRTPMNAVTGLSRLLQKTSLSPQQKNYVTSISASSDVIVSLIDDVLDISRIEAGKLETRQKPFSLKELLNSIETIFKPQALEKGLQLEVVRPEIPNDRFTGDKMRLHQILNNLIGNAIKFTDDGIVTLSVEALENSADKARLRFSVSDTGIGIGEQQQIELFEPFYQVDQEYTRRHGGVGLGLAISKQLVELMGGKLNLKSSLGKGSIFEFSIDLTLSGEERASEETGIQNRQHQQKFPQGTQILLVDDDEMNRKIAQFVLEGMGAKVTPAEAGSVAINLLKECRPDLILMDIQMPGMNGYETSRKIRENNQWKQLPIIALTAHTVEGERERCLAAGMNDYLTKPLKPDQLNNTVRQWLVS